MTTFFKPAVIVFSLFLISAAETPNPSRSPVAAPLARKLTVRAQEVFDQRKLRIYAVADESDAQGRFLINTLDSRSFKLFGSDPKEAPLEAASLSTVATKSPAVSRETAILFESSNQLNQQISDSVRKAVAAFLNGYRSDVLTVRMGNEDKNSRLAWISPSQSENPRAVQRSILDSPAVQGTQGMTSPVCAGVRDLNIVGSQNSQVMVQRNVIIVSSAHSAASKKLSELRACLAEAVDYGARVFWIEIKDAPTPAAVQQPEKSVAPSGSDFSKVISSAVEKSGGIRLAVGGTADPAAAFANLRSYLDDEYVLEFDLSQFRPYSDVIELELVANYHGHVLKSGFFKAEGFTAQPTPDDLERSARLTELRKRKETINLIVIFVLVSGLGIVLWNWLRRKAHVCRDCTYVVEHSFSDCPFRNAKCYGRLSVIHGPMTGKVFPLFSGDNTLGRGGSNTVRLKGEGVERLHAKIVLSKRKALLTPVSKGGIRVNGLLTGESRLVGSGTVLCIGSVVCRLDFKNGE
ncbi:MAG: FHA domain-containing protein [Proteobacteria bacterium]|nr:FHA domain-containing protein [Pseudomonadota bacterium]